MKARVREFNKDGKWRDMSCDDIKEGTHDEPVLGAALRFLSTLPPSDVYTINQEVGKIQIFYRSL